MRCSGLGNLVLVGTVLLLAGLLGGCSGCDAGCGADGSCLGGACEDLCGADAALDGPGADLAGDLVDGDLPGDLAGAELGPDAGQGDQHAEALEGDASPGEVDGEEAGETQGADTVEEVAAGELTADVGPATLGVMSVEELVQALPQKDFLLINVHVPYEGEIPGTDANLSYQDLPALAAFLGEDLDRRAVLYCKSNYMSKLAGNGLVDLGYRGLSYLDGGMTAWTSAGHSLEQR
jgi:rhodanese-related sulfurtransferase